MTRHFRIPLPGSRAGNVLRNQVHDLVNRLVPLDEVTVLGEPLSTG